MRGFNYKKTVQSLNLFAQRSGGTINKMKAIKLIWLSDRLHLRKYGRTITGDDYYALPFGPVPSGTRDVLEKNNFIPDLALDYASEYITEIDQYNFKTILNPNKKVFSQSDLEVLNLVFDSFSKYDHFALRDISHVFPEWKKWESALSKGISSRVRMQFLDFFQNSESYHELFEDSPENLELSKAMFIASHEANLAL
ncbi:MAG: DUF4065 domain-containing protein [Bacteroidia bacterium]|nr:DUF4065 domain-containing protein [Bacteroidia bacterium]